MIPNFTCSTYDNQPNKFLQASTAATLKITHELSTAAAAINPAKLASHAG